MAERAEDSGKNPLASLWGNLSYGLRSLNQYIEQSSIESFRELAVRLVDIINRIRFMVIIPEQFLIYEQMKLRDLSHHLWAALRTETVKLYDTLTDDERAAYEAALKKSYEKAAGDVEQDKMFEQWLSRAMQEKPRAIELLSMDEPYKSLLYSGLIWAWISFEVFASDLWEAVVNMATGKVRSRILSSFSTARPTIKIDYIAKYDYDLRGHLGTVMKDSYDFTSLNGIQKAYKVIFPKSQNISDALDKSELIEFGGKPSSNSAPVWDSR